MEGEKKNKETQMFIIKLTTNSKKNLQTRPERGWKNQQPVTCVSEITMKLSICLLLAVVAAASADEGFYQQQPVAQSAPSGYGYNNYYDYQSQPVKKQGYVGD